MLRGRFEDRNVLRGRLLSQGSDDDRDAVVDTSSEMQNDEATSFSPGRALPDRSNLSAEGFALGGSTLCDA
jgi:hypothetical protein